MEDKNTSIRRLKHLFFGARTEKTDAVVGRGAEEPEATSQDSAATDTELAGGKPDQARPGEVDGTSNIKGHGRNGANAYRSATRINVRHQSLTAADACPACGDGIVYEKAPGVLVRITGQPPLVATIYELQKLRWRRVHEPDLHLSVKRGQPIRLLDSVAAAR